MADRAEVGEGLQDHYVVAARYRMKPGVVTVNDRAHGWPFLREVARYVFKRQGLLTLSAAHVAAFVKSRPGLAAPDLQFHILPATMDIEKLSGAQKMVLEQEPGLTLAPCQLRPESRGSVRIRSPDPAAHPAIQPNYLSDPLDRETVVAGLKWARRIAAQPALVSLVDRELPPGAGLSTDAELLALAQMGGTTIYHPVGTCRMGGDPGAVVDLDLCVNGVERLRVVDASVMPRLVSGNTNAPTMMIAEKAADLIRGRRIAA